MRKTSTVGPDSKCIWPEDREQVLRKMFQTLDKLLGEKYGAVITTTLTRIPDEEELPNT